MPSRTTALVLPHLDELCNRERNLVNSTKASGDAMRIAISTGGGDAPGLNAVIRAAVLSAVRRGWDVLGIKRGYAGLLGDDEVIPLTRESVQGIAHLGGTILRTTNRANPFQYPRPRPDGTLEEVDRSDDLLKRVADRGIDAII